MCGIAGLFDVNGKTEYPLDLLKRLNEVQHHRGPDEDGHFLQPGVALGHKRLSIIDLSSGQQPMSTPDGQLTIIYNGEIYNFKSLADELRGLGHQFQTRSDTEVILHAWRQWGVDCVRHFRGMFTFALYDAQRQSLFLARDRLGIKPLFYSVVEGGTVVFGSELKVLKEHPSVQRRLDVTALEDYFALGYVPEPKTIYRDVYKLRPGHTLLLERGKPVPDQHEYWDVPFSPVSVGSEESLQDELVARIREAVDIRLVSEIGRASCRERVYAPV